ncbi:hypothetical protein [Pimelobacter simplex]|uniref:hypothetical protein n=1 Tax=Nocardioides simplex TaxID=2045 RepID=UPI003AAD8732
MPPLSQVLVELAEGSVPGLVLKTAPDGRSVLVTYELDGHVATAWLPVEKVSLTPGPR